MYKILRVTGLKFSVILLSCKAKSFKEAPCSFSSHCSLQPALCRLTAQVLGQCNHNICGLNSRAAIQTKAFLPKEVIVRSHISPAAAVHSMNASGPKAKTTKPVSVSSLLIPIYKTKFPRSGYAFRTHGWFKLTSNNQLSLAQVSAPRWFSCLLR